MSTAGTGDLSAAPGDLPREDNVKAVRFLAAGLAGLVVAWLALNFALGRTGIATISQQAQIAILAASVLDKVLGALVLFLLAADSEKARLRWVATGLLVFGLGPFVFVSLVPLLGGVQDVDTRLYRALIVWTFAFALFAVGLFPKSPPHFSWRRALFTFAAFGGLTAITILVSGLLPALATANLREIATQIFNSALQPGLTSWHFLLSLLPMGLATAAALGALRRDSSVALRGWLVAAMVLMAGSQLHHIFWPLAAGPVLTAMPLLHFAAGITIVVGGIVELRHIAEERSELLAVEKEHLERMRELATLKADFTAMVAHELNSPLAAIRGYTDMLSTGKLSPERQKRALEAIRTETSRLNALISDVRTAAAVERDDFTIQPVPVGTDQLLNDAVAYARTLPGGYPIAGKASVHGQVLADPDRIGQVLRNLLDNAATYSPPGTPIELRAVPVGGPDGTAQRIRFEVADRGPGIHPEDLERVFEKFGRGTAGEKTTGVGLGLYLSRRIVRVHGGELTVDSTPGEGSVFAFELEVVS